MEQSGASLSHVCVLVAQHSLGSISLLAVSPASFEVLDLASNNPPKEVYHPLAHLHNNDEIMICLMALSPLHLLPKSTGST